MAVASASEVFERHIPERLKAKPELVAKTNAKYKFVLTGDGGSNWMVDLTAAPGRTYAGDDSADCTITMGVSDFVDMVNGKLNAQMAFMMGKLKVAGDMGLALKLGALLG